MLCDVYYEYRVDNISDNFRKFVKLGYINTFDWYSSELQFRNEWIDNVYVVDEVALTTPQFPIDLILSLKMSVRYAK